MIVFLRGSYIICQRVQTLKFAIICKMRDSYMCLVCSRAANWILHSLAYWWKDGDLRHIHSIFH
ncbi:hypothetical protein Goshw_011177, partial [Gossypium schwendimanii]|nr:hypothetical protein [Gossypium schwendimanii]